MRKREMHGLRYTPEYLIWKSMIKRCHNPNDPAYHRYGGRGILVCESWKNSFLAFFRSVGTRPKGLGRLSIDRLDNNRGYEPGNVEWRTAHDQTRNKRSNLFYFIRGENLILKDAYKIYGTAGINYHTVRRRVFKMGWTVEQAISTPALSH